MVPRAVRVGGDKARVEIGMPMESAGNPFDRVTLEQLRTRKSAKWRVFAPDVLPLWVAEMDTIVAEPIIEAVHRALTAGDTGYPHGLGVRRGDGGLRPAAMGLGDRHRPGPHRVDRRHERRGRDAAGWSPAPATRW